MMTNPEVSRNGHSKQTFINAFRIDTVSAGKTPVDQFGVSHYLEKTEINLDADFDTKPFQTKSNEQTKRFDCDQSEGVFIKGHARKDSGHVFVTGLRSGYDDTFSPIASSDEEDCTVVKKTTKTTDAKTTKCIDISKKGVDTFQEKSDGEDLEKDTEPKSVVTNNESYSTRETGPETNRYNKKKSTYPVEYDFSTDTNLTSDLTHAIGTDIAKHGEIHTRQKDCDFSQHGIQGSIDKKHNGWAESRKNANSVDFAEAIRDNFAELVHADIDVMELSDYLYQYRIMNMRTYEEFFELSHTSCIKSKRNLQRRLLIFLSKPLPRDLFELAVAEAGYLPIFLDVLKKAIFKSRVLSK